MRRLVVHLYLLFIVCFTVIDESYILVWFSGRYGGTCQFPFYCTSLFNNVTYFTSFTQGTFFYFSQEVAYNLREQKASVFIPYIYTKDIFSMTENIDRLF